MLILDLLGNPEGGNAFGNSLPPSYWWCFLPHVAALVYAFWYCLTPHNANAAVTLRSSEG